MKKQNNATSKQKTSHPTTLKPNISIKNISQHTIIATPKSITIEHLAHVNAQKHSQSDNVTPFQCLNQNKMCNCPQYANCTLLLATRAQLLFQYLPLSQQIIVPFSKNEKPLLRRKPPPQYSKHMQHKQQERYSQYQSQQHKHHYSLNQDNTNQSKHQDNTTNQSKHDYPLNQDNTINQSKHDYSLNQDNTINQSKHDYSLNQDNTINQSLENGALAGTEWSREEKLLERLVEREARTGSLEGGITINGLRYGARETLRLLRAVERSQAVAKDKVPRIWAIRIARGFERRAIPYTVERCNYDSLCILLSQSVDMEVEVDERWWPVICRES